MDDTNRIAAERLRFARQAVDAAHAAITGERVPELPESYIPDRDGRILPRTPIKAGPFGKQALDAIAEGLRLEVAAPQIAAVKFVDGSDDLIEGLAIPFGGPVAGKDFDGEDFGPDTDLALDWFPAGRPVIYHHGLDGAMKTALQGRQYEHEITDEGVWARVQLDKSAQYHATVARLIAEGKLFFSSGSAPNLVEATKDGHITRWPWLELSLTPTPANLWATVHPVKSTDLIGHLAEAGIEPSAQLIAAALKALDGPPASATPERVPDLAEEADTEAAKSAAPAFLDDDRTEYRRAFVGNLEKEYLT